MSKDLTAARRNWVQEGRQFVTEVRTEFRKITWPTRQETVAGTIGVLVIVAVITAVLSLADLVLAQAVKFVIP